MNLIKRADKKKRRIAAIGMYDGVHPGHRFLIDYLTVEARSRGLVPAVVTFTEHPLSIVRPEAAPGLLTSLDERLALLGQAGIEDCILLKFDDSIRRKSARQFLSMLNERYGIKALVVGFNNRFGHDRVDGIEQYRQIGGEIGMDIIQAPEYKGKCAPVSSSIIRGYISSGDIENANRALDRNYSFNGIVVEGNRLGRSIGFPTANLRLTDNRRLLPKDGVYAVYATTPDGKRRPAMLNIGFRPTVSERKFGVKERSIEVHIIGFKGYLYDEELKIEIVRFMRDERRFGSLDELKSQLKADLKNISKTLNA